MATVRLTMDQLNFLRSNIENPESATALSQNTSAHKRHPNQKEEIDLSDETFEKILFELAILLAGVGFGKDDKPTEMGYYIEDLIDALHAG